MPSFYNKLCKFYDGTCNHTYIISQIHCEECLKIGIEDSLQKNIINAEWLLVDRIMIFEIEYSLENISSAVNKLLEAINLGPKLWLFRGEMGAGKTTLVNEIGQQIKIKFRRRYFQSYFI